MSLPSVSLQTHRADSLDYLAVVDQGTSSTRCLILHRDGTVVASAGRPLPLAFPRPGWVEQDPLQIIDHAQDVLREALSRAAITSSRLAALGITNQRETVVIWDRRTGQPIGPAVVWQDRRTVDACSRLRADGVEEQVRARTGLPLDPYFSATKIAWLLDSHPGLRACAENLIAGTIDTWLLWNLTGGPEGGIAATDVTNASRTQLLDLERLTWDRTMAEVFDVPLVMLPEVRPSARAEPFGIARIDGAEIPILAVLGDQQAALVGQKGLSPGDIKNTYGTGSFLLMNTGGGPPRASRHGLLSTVAYQFGDAFAAYALEGSVFTTGAAIQWLRDGISIIATADETSALALSVPDAGGVVFVPAFAGLGAPYWDADARGAIFGLTRGTTRAHLVRATLEAIAHQTREVVDAMQADAPDLAIPLVYADGGAAANDFLCQFQADLLSRPVVRPGNLEQTALGAAHAAGWAAGFWNLDDAPLSQQQEVFTPQIPFAAAEAEHKRWKKAVQRVLERTGE